MKLPEQVVQVMLKDFETILREDISDTVERPSPGGSIQRLMFAMSGGRALVQQLHHDGDATYFITNDPKVRINPPSPWPCTEVIVSSETWERVRSLGKKRPTEGA